MKIVTWNINGIRTVRGPIKALLDSFEADVICFQETKVTRDMLDESIAAVEGYNAYFSYSRKRSGYSGVVTYCRDSVRPVAAEEGISGYWASLRLASQPAIDSVGVYGSLEEYPAKKLQELDEEGRSVVTEHRFRKANGEEGRLCIFNVYCPRADKDREDRKAYKLWFCEMLQVRTEALLASGRHVVVVGDLNTSHRPIDTCDSSGPDYATSSTRQWLDYFIHDAASKVEVDYNSGEGGHRMVDAFRRCHPDRLKAYTCWSTATGARTLNYGCRIDYVLGDFYLVKESLRASEILPEINGSDHCPVWSEFNIAVIPADKCPSLCARWMPEFTGKQQKLSSFFRKAVSNDVASQDFTPRATFPSQASKGLRLSDYAMPAGKAVQPGAKRKVPSAGQKSLLDFFGKKPKMDEPASSPSTDRLSSIASVSVSHYPTTPGGSSSSELIDLASDDTLPGSHPVSSDSFQSNQSHEPESTVRASVTAAEFVYSRNSDDSVAQWRALLCGPSAAPLCPGHKEPCVLKTCRKQGPNKNRQFYMCSRPEGDKKDASARCQYFKWIGQKKM